MANLRKNRWYLDTLAGLNLRIVGMLGNQVGEIFKVNLKKKHWNLEVGLNLRIIGMLGNKGE
jgi:hypothetical protein